LGRAVGCQEDLTAGLEEPILSAIAVLFVRCDVRRVRQPDIDEFNVA
jgi:hypothetical protein